MAKNKKSRKNVKATQNLAGKIERPPAPRQGQEQLYAIPGGLKQTAIDALQNSAPRQLSVQQVNGICAALSQLRPISGVLQKPDTLKKGKLDGKA